MVNYDTANEHVSNVVELDIEHCLYLIEAIAKEFIVIEDIELCWFVPTLRYPIDKKKIINVEFENVKNYPILALYSSGIVRDTIAYSIAMNSRYKKHLYRNCLVEESNDNILRCYDNYDEKISDDIEINVNNKKQDLYSITDIPYDDIRDIIDYHITTPGFYQKQKEVKELEIAIKTHFAINAGSDWYKNKMLHDSYLSMIDSTTNEIDIRYSNNLLLKLEEELIRLSTYIINLNLPSDNVFTINDENRAYKIIYGEHILERRLKEIEKF